jgi:hypothetical protein
MIIDLTPDELRHVISAMNEYLYNMAKLERTFNIKILDTLSSLANAHRKLLIAQSADHQS